MDNDTSNTAVPRVARLIAGYLRDPNNPTTSAAQAYRRVAARDRPHVSAAIEYAREQGWALVADDYAMTPGPSVPAARKYHRQPWKVTP